MLKLTLLLGLAVLLVNVGATSANAQAHIPIKWGIKKVLKSRAKAEAKRTGKRGAEETCMYGPFFCEKVAKAPGPIQPRGPQRVPIQPRGPQRFRSRW
jgi:hypothetical protein